ncbi:MAG: hypothetical protein IKT40_01520 [Bacilli bacterium]|nr:hypothetical protein [Bacilli bacterium]
MENKKNHKYTTEEFIEKVKKVHEDKNYDYSNLEYVNAKTKVKVYCHEKDSLGNEHGFFEIKATHLISGHGCPKCCNRVSTLEDKINRLKEVHGDKYDYSEIVENFKTKSKIPIICHEKDEFGNEHGVFYQKYDSHLMGCGCPKCNKGITSNLEEFIKMANSVHNNFYSYDKFVYVNAKTKGIITCPIHGDFEQSPDVHLNRKHSCPKCKSSILEKEVIKLLTENNINYEHQCYLEELGKKSIDFKIGDSIYIECQGEQHYRPVNFQNYKENITEDSIENFNNRKLLDAEKYDVVVNKNHGTMIYYTKTKYFRQGDYDVKSDFYSDKIVCLNEIELLETINKISKENDINIQKTSNKDLIVENIKKYKEKRKTNSLGSTLYWTYDKCKEEAKKYNTKSEMRDGNQSAYKSSVKFGWIDEFYDSKKKKDKYWDDINVVLDAAKKSRNAKDMSKKFGGAYNSARKNNWLHLLEYNQFST